MARDLSGYQAEIREVRRLFFLAFPVCLLIIGIGGWFVARRAMRPVELIANTASRVTARGLDQRIPKGVHDYAELSHLVDVLNGMMDRLDGSFRHAMRFSADVSHELKTPLAVMQVAVQDALKECPPGSSEEESLLTVSQETERLKRITRSLMLLAQADAGQLSVRPESFSLSKEVEAVCEDAEILCEKAGLSFEADIQGNVQASADPVLLRQAIQNLVSNAVKYNQPGGSVQCRLFPVDGANEIVFEISNTGPGIAEEEQQKIFDRFYRVDQSRSREVDGFGLGLNLAWEIVRAMNGELLLVESNDKITRFQIRLKTSGSGEK
jgi:two-component system heavy metal sensor histidine kinase CusS